MLNDASCFKQVYIVTGYTDLRSGIDRLAALVQSHLGDHCFEPDTSRLLWKGSRIGLERWKALILLLS